MTGLARRQRGLILSRSSLVIAYTLFITIAPVFPAQDTNQVDPPEGSRDFEPIPARVIEVAGTVDWAAAGVSPLVAEGWTAVVLGDLLEPGSLIRTGLRSHVNLQFGETTTVSIRGATYASIDQFYRSATMESVRIGLGYGTVRGGSSEGQISADVTVDSTVATLAKRGTEGWEIAVEPGTGRFRISLAEYGLVEATAKLAGQRAASRTVRPGEYATQANIANMWLEQDIFDRNVHFFETTAMTDADVRFMASNTRSFGELGPGGGATLVDLTGRTSAAAVGALSPATLDSPMIGPTVRPEGNFGTPDTLKPGFP